MRVMKVLEKLLQGELNVHDAEDTIRQGCVDVNAVEGEDIGYPNEPTWELLDDYEDGDLTEPEVRAKIAALSCPDAEKQEAYEWLDERTHVQTPTAKSLLTAIENLPAEQREEVLKALRKRTT
jgi:hypothetical protein